MDRDTPTDAELEALDREADALKARSERILAEVERALGRGMWRRGKRPVAPVIDDIWDEFGERGEPAIDLSEWCERKR